MFILIISPGISIVNRTLLFITQNDKTTLFIIDVPVIEKENNEQVYSTMPLGMIVVRDDYFIKVSLKQNRVVSELEKGKEKNNIISILKKIIKDV